VARTEDQPVTEIRAQYMMGYQRSYAQNQILVCDEDQVCDQGQESL
jgi:hypothetical protein